MATGTTISLPFDSGSRTFDRDRLATAVLVYLDVLGDDKRPLIHHSKTAALRLRDDHGFGTDAITYAIGARIAIENGIEP